MRWYRNILLCFREMLGGSETTHGKSYGPGLVFGATAVNVLSIMAGMGFDIVGMWRTGWWIVVAAVGAVHAVKTDEMIARAEHERGSDELLVAAWTAKWRSIVIGYLGGSVLLFGLAIALALWRKS